MGNVPTQNIEATLPEALKMEVTTKANELIKTVLKPKYIQPPPENPQFNYIVDIYGKWYHRAFYFCAEYRVAGPNPIQPSFEAKFARMQYAGNRRFHLLRVLRLAQQYSTDPGQTILPPILS